MDMKETFEFYKDFYIEVAKKFTVFEGRARRKEFWMFWLLNLIIGVAVGIVCGIFGLIPGIGRLFGFISYAVSIAIAIISFSTGVRRLHDTNRSGLSLLFCLIPLVGWIIVIVFWVQDSTDDNKYGPNPKKDEPSGSSGGFLPKSSGDTVFCSGCGKKNDAGSKFCESCGEPLQQKKKTPASGGTAKKTAKK